MVDFSAIEMTSKKVRRSNVDFSSVENTSSKVRGNNVDVSISEITSKKYAEMTWKFVEIFTSNLRRFDVECPVGTSLFLIADLVP